MEPILYVYIILEKIKAYNQVVHPKKGKSFVIYMHSDSVSILLSDWSEVNSKAKRYKNWFTGKQYLVIDYNNYKAKNLVK